MDYYNGNNRGEDKQVKLMDKVYDWWEGLTEGEQHNIIENWYPLEFLEDDDADKFFCDMPNDTQLWIYQRENKCTEEDIEGQKDRADDIKAHEKMERGIDEDI